MAKTVLSYGGTGVQGGPMARAFAAAGWQTRTITRNPDSDAANALRETGIEVVQGNLSEPASLATAHKGVDVVALLVPFFGPPTMDRAALMQNAVNAAAAAGVERIVWNASGPMPEQQFGNPMIDAPHALQSILAGAGVPWVTVVPSAYMENLMGPWTAGGVRDADEIAYPLAEGNHLGWISTGDMAALMVAAAAQPDVENRIFRVNGPGYLSGPQMAEAFSQGLGREITWRELTPREFGNQVGAVMGKEAGDGLAMNYAFIAEHHDTIMPDHDMDAVLAQLPVTLTPLADWVRAHAFAFAKAEAPSEA
ncbi:MAG: NmrA family NAD(P)-binding protein [Chloroflexota bacterium]